MKGVSASAWNVGMECQVAMSNVKKILLVTMFCFAIPLYYQLAAPCLGSEPAVFGNIADRMSGDVITFPAIVVDYRDDQPTHMREAGLLRGPLPMVSHDGGAALGGCAFDVDCDDGNPCTFDICTFPSGQPAAAGFCENTAVPNGSDGAWGSSSCPQNFGLGCGGCNDGLYCNGVETCQNGVCTDGPDPCPGVCAEDFNLCQSAPCVSAANCSQSAIVGAALAAEAVRTCNGDESCDGGVCRAGSNPCGTGAVCSEKRCSLVGSPNLPLAGNVPCVTDEDCVQYGASTCSVTGPACDLGRCCSISFDPTCSRRLKYQGRCVGGSNPSAPCRSNSDCGSDNCNFSASCDALGGQFYGGDSGTIPGSGGTTCGIDSSSFQIKCPKYGSGIAPGGDFSSLLGPISFSPMQVAPFGAPLQKLGDDYMLSNSPGFLALDHLRFAGGSPFSGRVAFEFYDEDGHFVEDFYYPGTQAFGVYSVLLDPPLTITASGYVVMRAAQGFSPDGRHVWAATNGVDVGTNNPNKLWVNGGPVSSNFGTTGILAFELEGTKVAGSFGACCHTNPDSCDNAVLPWDCIGTGGQYLGDGALCAACDTGALAGQYCRRCSNDTGQQCNTDSECGAGTCLPFDGACGGAVCVAQPACNVGGCCDPNSGACTVETEASCTSNNRNYLGNGSDCDVDDGYDDGQQHCCPQPQSNFSGADRCEDAIVHFITVPSPGSPPTVVTIDGDNAAATFEPNDWCCAPNEECGLDLGWWEAFEIDKEAYLRIDFCCSEPVDRGAYSRLFSSCPCGQRIFPKSNPLRYPEPANSRGAPYCPSNSAWMNFGPLPAGRYYYQVYSVPGAGTFGPYTMHITVDPVMIAACCVSDQCTDGLSQSECDSLGGVFLAPPQRFPAISDCADAPCATGSCCPGPGECVDTFLGQEATLADCDGIQAEYIGGIRCRGGTCASTPVVSCATNQDCPNLDCTGDPQSKAQPLPCPMCAIESENNCQPFEDVMEFTFSDRNFGNGMLAADDITPIGDTLSEVCVWGFYLNVDPDAPVNDCGPLVSSDHFRVRVYNNDPATGRSPGTFFAESLATSERGVLPNTVVYSWIDTEVYGFQLTLNSPISGLSPGRVYWLEVSNDVSDSDWSCRWLWMRKTPSPTSFSFTGDNDGYASMQAVTFDQAFCVNFDITPSNLGALDAACCPCDQNNCVLRTLYECSGTNGDWDITRTSCDGVICNLVVANNQCDNGPPTIAGGTYAVDNRCATTDGYGPIPTDFGDAQIASDLWYYYIAPADCPLVVSECLTGNSFDSILAVYHNPNEPTVCPPCPLNATISQATLAGLGQDESCTGGIGGPGYWNSLEQIGRNALPGECFLIRVGSFFEDDTGMATLSISCGNYDPPPQVVPDTANKSRFISFDIPSPATAGVGDSAIRIDLTQLHFVVPPYPGGGFPVFLTAFYGLDVYAGPPQLFVESATSETPLWVSFAQCTPHYQDWSTVGTLHVTGPMIMPSSTYTVDHLGSACMGSEQTCTAFSPGPEIRTTRWGDVATPFNPPSSTVQPDVADIGALVDKFRNAPGAIGKARALLAGVPGNAWGEITAEVLSVDFGFSHISACVDAFRGSPYIYKPGKCTGAPTPPATGACTTNSDCNGPNGSGPCNLYCP